MIILGDHRLRVFFKETMTLTGRFVDYQCRPRANQKIIAHSIIQRGGFLRDQIVRDTEYITDTKGEFQAKVYLGDGVNFFSQDKLLGFIGWGAIRLLNNRVKNDYIALYEPVKFKDYKLTTFNKWIFEPRSSLHAFGKRPTQENRVFAKDFVGGISYGADTKEVNNAQLTITINPVDISDLNKGWKIIIGGNKREGLIRVKPDDIIDGYIPTEGYTESVEILLPNKTFPYEMEDKWKHLVFYLKSNVGNSYGIIALDMSFTSPFSKDDHDELLPQIINYYQNKGMYYRADLALSIWSKVDIIHSSHPIKLPYIPQKNCGGVLQDTARGFYGHHFPRNGTSELQKQLAKYWRDELSK